MPKVKANLSIMGIVSLDDHGMIRPCDDPNNPSAWFIIQPPNGRLAIYNGEVARTVLGAEMFCGSIFSGASTRPFLLADIYGLTTVGEFKPMDNDLGVDAIQAYLKTICGEADADDQDESVK